MSVWSSSEVSPSAVSNLVIFLACSILVPNRDGWRSNRSVTYSLRIKDHIKFW